MLEMIFEVSQFLIVLMAMVLGGFFVFSGNIPGLLFCILLLLYNISIKISTIMESIEKIRFLKEWL